MNALRTLCAVIALGLCALAARGQSGKPPTPPSEQPSTYAKVSDAELEDQIEEYKATVAMFDEAIVTVQTELSSTKQSMSELHKTNDDGLRDVISEWFKTAKGIRDAENLEALTGESLEDFLDLSRDLYYRDSFWYNPPRENAFELEDGASFATRKAAAAARAAVKPRGLPEVRSYVDELDPKQKDFLSLIEKLRAKSSDDLSKPRDPASSDQLWIRSRESVQQLLRSAELTDDMPESTLDLYRKIDQAGYQYTKAAYDDYVKRLEAAEADLASQRQTAKTKLNELRNEQYKRQKVDKSVIESNMMVLLIGMMAVIVLMLFALMLFKSELSQHIITQRTLVELAGMTFLLMVVLLLASGAKINPETTGTLLGTLAGYILSRRSGSDQKPKEASEHDAGPPRDAGNPARPKASNGTTADAGFASIGPVVATAAGAGNQST